MRIARQSPARQLFVAGHPARRRCRDVFQNVLKHRRDQRTAAKLTMHDDHQQADRLVFDQIFERARQRIVKISRARPHDAFIGEAFRRHGLAPAATVITSSVVVANHLLATNQAVAVTSRFAAKSAGLNVLPIDLGLGSWPALVLTLKNRTLNPVAERFIACAREVLESMCHRRKARAQSRA